MSNVGTGSVQIIPFYSHPHVHTVIKDNSWYDETVADRNTNVNLPYSTLCVTGGDSGIDNKFVRLTDINTKKAIFGAGNYQRYGQASIQGDILFNGYTNVWFMRVLPDNATYANIIVLAHYRKGKILDELGQETGKYRLEVKFSTVSADKTGITSGTINDDVIEQYAQKLGRTTVDPQTGYITVPLMYVRSIGRGKYGNNYSISITRDVDFEKEYDLKGFKINLISNSKSTKVINQFSGSLYQTARNNVSMLIDDINDLYAEGSCPVYIHSFEENFLRIYDFYKNEVIRSNIKYIQGSGSLSSDLEELELAQSITEETFDPIFGVLLNSRTDEIMPYYRNYTVKDSGVWTPPALEVPNTAGATKPLNIRDWTTAYVGAKVLVAADPLNDGYRWMYTVTSINPSTGNIVYDEGVETAIDEDQYNGSNLSQSVGFALDGGSDGDFDQITVNGETRQPTAAEMKLLLSREYVKAFRGLKDRRILSPARIDLDFMFDANYNMTTDETIGLDNRIVPLYTNSTVITDKDAQQLSILANYGGSLEFSDLNVKKAMYDLNNFRNINGMTISGQIGAGCSLYLDCGLVGLKNIGINSELAGIINSMMDFKLRSTSIDLGYYSIFDPATSRKIKVTVDYYIAKNLIPHIMTEGLNKPFTYNFASITAIQPDTELITTNEMIRDSFQPAIDLIDWDVKEALYKSRINYWLVGDEGRTAQRACQNTCQRDASALLEENNVRVLNTLKKNLEKACRGYLYEWNEPTVRKGYTDAQMEIYKPWVGTMVKDISIKFTANKWEQERMIMHCIVEVEFRGIAKRIILEININKPNYETEEGGAA